MKRRTLCTRRDRGSVLIIAVMSLLILAVVLAATLNVVSNAMHTWRRAGRLGRVRQALDAGLSRARARLDSSDAPDFTDAGEHDGVPYRAVCKALGQERCGLEVLAGPVKGAGGRITAELVRVRHPDRDQAWVWRILRYEEAAP